MSCSPLKVAAAVDQFHDLRHAVPSRDANLGLFRDTFARRGNAVLCVDCFVAVLHAARR